MTKMQAVNENFAKKFIADPANHKECEFIWGLSKLGVSNRNIAANDNVTISYESVRFVLKEIARERVEEMGGIDIVRIMESSKLDDLTNVWATKLNKLKKQMNDGVAIDEKTLQRCSDQLLKIAERKAKLLGLDAPIKHQVNLRVFDQFTAQLIEIIQTNCSPEIQKKINADIQRALSVAEKYRNENEEAEEWAQTVTSD